MSWVAVAIGGSAVVGAVASNAAAGQQANAAGDAAQISQNQYGQTRNDLMPYQKFGTNSLEYLNPYLGLGKDSGQPYYGQGLQPFTLDKFKESPAYQFNLQQGQQAINKSAAARGNYYAPQTLQDISKFSQGMASNEFNNAYSMYNQDQNNIYSRLMGAANLGESAATQTGAFGANSANQVGQATMAGGNARAAGTVGVANAIQGGVGDYYNAWLTNQILSRNQAGMYGSGQAPAAGMGWSDPYGYGVG